MSNIGDGSVQDMHDQNTERVEVVCAAESLHNEINSLKETSHKSHEPHREAT